MPNANLVVLMGHLVRDPEVKYLGSGSSICNATIATSKKWKDKASGQMKEKTAFIDLRIWNGSGERFAEWFSKGSAVHVTGSIEQESWEDKQSGQKRSKLSVKVLDYQGVGGRRDTVGASSDSGDDDTDGEVPF